VSALGRTLALARRDALLGAAAIGLQAAAVASSLLLMGTSAWLLSKAALHPSIAALQVAIVGVRAFGIARASLRYAERLVSHDVTLRLLGRLRAALLRALAPLAPARLVDDRRGDLLARFLDDVTALEGLFPRVVAPTLAAVAVAAMLALVLRPLGPSLAAAAVAGFALAGFAGPALAARAGAAPGRRLVATRGALAARALDGVMGVGDLLAAGAEAEHAAAVARDSDRAAAEQRRLARATAAGTVLPTLGADLTALAVLALAVPLVTAGRLDGVYLATAVLLALAAFEAVAPLPQAWHAAGAMKAAAARVFEIVDRRPAVVEPSGPAPEPVPGAPLVEIVDLRFTYPGARVPAIDGLSLRLDAGRRVALVGPSGSGKSTVAQLLLRFRPAPPGAIRLEGHGLETWPSDLARARVSFASQRAHVFTGTLRENLRLARADATDEEMRAVLASLGLDPARWPGGLDTPVGEEGRRLSGGERQRLALARALLRPAPLLLLDEPTAHLDAVTERGVIEALLRAGEGRATLMATHRLAGLDAFDEVVVLDRGRVVERGAAAELRESAGAFARLEARQRSIEALGDEPLSSALA